MGFSRQEYWSGLPCPPPGDLPNSGIKLVSLVSHTLAGVLFVCLFLPLEPPGKSLASEGHTQTSTRGWVLGPLAVDH